VWSTTASSRSSTRGSPAAGAPPAAGGEAAVFATGVSKRFGPSGRQILADAGFTVGPRESVSIVGPSGTGKTTLLNMVAGLLRPDTGSVALFGRRIEGPQTSAGYLTQKDTLFPWRTAQANVELPLKLAGWRRQDRRAAAREMLARVGLADAADHYPAQLSGGMRRRAALARLLVTDPAVLLLDEPFSALDAQLRLEMQAELMRITAGSTRPLLLVTHDLDEAITVADRVLVLRGRPATVATALDVPIERPRDPVKVRFEPAFQALHDRLWEEMGHANG
jgi:sulfonate transport system ATP-binding protein